MKRVIWKMTTEGEGERYQIKTPIDVLKIIDAEKLHEKDREHMTVFNLDTNANLISHEVVSIGTVDATLGAPRETFKSAVSSGASSIILCHNHPSGDVTPSAADILLTHRILACGMILGIPVNDHVIVGPTKNYTSMGASGLLHPDLVKPMIENLLKGGN